MPILSAMLVSLTIVFAVLALRPTPAGTPVLVATEDIPMGSTVSNRNASVTLLPPIAVPDGALTQFTGTAAGKTT